MIEPDLEELSLEEVFAQARDLATTGERHILGFTGAPGAGKSTVAEQVVAALGPELAVLVPMDGFHLANEVLLALGRRDRKGAHDTFDAAGYASLMQRIRNQPSTTLTGDEAIVYAPRFARELEEPIGSSLPIRPETPLIVTEGNYLLLDSGSWPAARECIDQVWFLSPLESVRHDRLVRRHEAFGKSHEDAELWALGSDQRNAELIESTAGRAERVLRLL
ncbi:nucleoside/nucleotide kinase family protein [Subtercola boreus]|uniref:Nucleoside/nucleotide kinase family protein n=1 Tax=Subtercola boreus TaxID=120213 RepID=A0A3E0W8T3_9MICO|nr:nucleoside/nucleotide kinase family protein [Subtercola boreus]RFA19002.1 nucleoside/nucleotide kinase family protein [Subtercola boreus]RFA19140.1 nucleoside/nucleotide kinase family protein [Subtercola boreus]RFA25602.1 nucleoside/nucleotide kinase family protein [Subtercola boreus]